MTPLRLSFRRLAAAALLAGTAITASPLPAPAQGGLDQGAQEQAAAGQGAPAQAAREQGAVFPPSSRFGFAAPADMVVSKRFTGFERKGGGAIVSVVELPGPAYTEMEQSFTDETLKAQGLIVRKRESVTLADDLPGVLFTGEATAGEAQGAPIVNKWLLIVGGPDVTGLVIAQAAAGLESEEAIRSMLTSVKVRGALGLDEQVAALPFRIGDPAGFRPVRALAGNSVLMTLGPRDQISAMEQPILVIAQATQNPTPQEQRDGLARQALFANQTMKDFQIERSQSYRQNGVDWHEIVARAIDIPSNTPVVVAQTIRFNPDGYIRAVGVTRADQRSDVLPLFRQVVDSLQMK